MPLLTNLVPKASFEEASGWSAESYSTTHVKYGTKALLLTGATSAPEITSATSTAIALNPTHMYYARFETYQENRCGSTDIYWPIAEPRLMSLDAGTAGTWNMHSVVGTRPTFATGSYALRIDFNNSYVSGKMWFDGIMLIDLTACFGSGAEPSKNWCDINIPFFQGSYNLLTAPTIQINPVSISPTVPTINSAFTICVNVAELMMVLKPEITYSGDYYSGETYSQGE